MDVDLFADPTALSPPPSARSHQHTAARSQAPMTPDAVSSIVMSPVAPDADAGGADIDDALVGSASSSVQWSADPSAFLVPGGSHARLQQQSPLRTRLALDLGSRQHAFRSERVSVSQLSQNTSYSQQHFADLFYADSQDEEEPDGILYTSSSGAGDATFVTRRSQSSGARQSPPAAVAFAMQDERSASGAKGEEDAVVTDEDDVAAMTPTPAPHTVQEHGKERLRASSSTEDAMLDAASTTRDAAPVVLTSRSPFDDREGVDDGDDDQFPAFQNLKRTSISSSPSMMPIAQHPQPPDALPTDDAETEPLFREGSEDGDDDHQSRRDSIDSFPDTQPLSDAEMEDDNEDDTENVNTEPMMEEDTEPVDGGEIEAEDVQMESAGDDTELVDDDENEVPPTQPSSSASAKTLSPVQDNQGKVAPSPSRTALSRHDKNAAHILPRLTDSEHHDFDFEGSSCTCRQSVCCCSGDGAEPTKLPAKVSGASRNLTFSFALPDSEENSRTVSAHSKNMFKCKFDFCVTGFAIDTQAKVVKMIEDHGGKVWEKEILHAGNQKAVVIATAISWRKLKFRYAVACGIPVVHPEWLRACVKAREPVPFDGYFVPSGYSIMNRKFECLPAHQLKVFAGLSFGIPYDVELSSKTSTKDLGGLIAFLLKVCGAKHVVEGLVPSIEKQVDIVLSDELTKTCRLYSVKHKAPVKNFSWVTECIVLQRLVQLDDNLFDPYTHDSEHRSLLAATAYIGGSERTQVKLYTGELVLVDLSKQQIENFLLFNVCEILRITSVRDGDDEEVMLEVGVMERNPNSPMLLRKHSSIMEIPASKVLRRVVAVSRADFDAIKYKDETMFYFDEGGEAA